MTVSECDTCGCAFEISRYGQGDCEGCKNVEAIRDEANSIINDLASETSSALEDCRDMADDILAILLSERLSKQQKDKIRELADNLRERATDAAPDPPTL